MKKFLAGSLFTVLCLAPWACNRQYPLFPLPGLPSTFTPTPTSTFTALPSKTFTSTHTIALTATPTATVTTVYTATPTLTATINLTPGCGAAINLGVSPIIPVMTVVFNTPVPTSTPGSWELLTSTPTPSVPVVTYPNKPFNGAVIQNLAQWQAVFGTATPPPSVNFNTQMLLVTSVLGGCDGSLIISNACVTSTEVEVTETGAPAEPCNLVFQQTSAWVVPQSNLPVVLTEFIENP